MTSTNKSILVNSHIMKIKIINERTEKDSKSKNLTLKRFWLNHQKDNLKAIKKE